MKALLDTNIIIHREAGRASNQDIGILFKWLDKAQYKKYIHPATIKEINKNPNKSTVEAFNIKMDSYELMLTTAPMAPQVKTVSNKYDSNENDVIDSILLNEVYNDRVDLLISEDKKSIGKHLNYLSPIKFIQLIHF
ncbi:PIN domain-containing protein [Mucilaginibacter sp. 21P]|uniref:PIN domain-containing protein n=1 Tax=Mucilaginibacter sp. 21P TaxID=2778902 RepID=UPI001C58EB79|nr:PIN domain-containing protein [Mucilaginibacter sp. 21P]